MANMSELYISELKHALNHKHASVLIGSGFSMNSDNVNPIETHKMPNWYELADAFCEKIGIDLKNPDILKENRYLDPLILADKVEAMYGRPFLDELLINQMKNDLHKPSELHKKLLSLPWNDVFTTNYDTLLERTLPEITNKYGLVLDQNDLMHSRPDFQSRIIKLHGSFPSSRPFSIIDEVITCLRDADVPHVLLRYCIEKTSSRTGILESSLFSEKEPERINAVNALRVIIKKDIPIPKRLIETIILAFRTANTLDGVSYCRPLISLIKDRKLSKAFCDDIASTLKKYDAITKVIPSDDNGSYGKKMESRETLAVLACSLKDYYSEMRLDQPDEVKNWENIVGDKEEFAEIRRSWE